MWTRDFGERPMEPDSFLDKFLPQVQGGKARPDFKGDVFFSAARSLRHHRMALGEIGRPLNTFYSSHELVTAVADAMEGLSLFFVVYTCYLN